ncbi:general substrate transporter [Epithele typhae]|uniref:general substrate transporter n=1 Tax=Epithele typhae TaxID=378194 RepID=UPI00200720D4|nr:general substrate transporter [Epithele typhae]KAH9941775.1 general substrate transporter [Epithele typhae]
MAVGPAATSSAAQGFMHLVDPNRKWYNNKRIIALNGWLVLLLITSSGNGFDGSLMNSLQSMYQWKGFFNDPQGGTLGLLNAIQNIGALGGYPFAPYLSDGLGRRPTVWIGAVCMIAGVALQTACQNINQFIGARFLIGFGLSIASNAAPMLVTEMSYPVYRPQLSALYNTLWYSGNIVASWTSFGTARINNDWSWRIPSLLQAIPALFQFFLIWFVPESPRFLISKGKETQALKTLAYYHADGDEQDPLVQYEFEEIKAAIALDRESSRNVGWKALVATRGNRKRIAIIIAIAWFSQWSGNGLVSYYLNQVFNTIGITNTDTQLLITGILAIWNLCWAVFASFQVDRWGRRFLFLTSAIGMCVFFTLQTICSAQYALHGNQAAAHAVIAFIFLFYAFYDLAFTPLIVSYTLEILPYSLRAKGFNVFNFTISVALIFNQYVNPIALKAIAWKYYIVYCVWLAFEVVILYFFIVETKNRTLEETAALFDGEELDKLHQATAKVAEIRHEDYDEKSSDAAAHV